MKKVFGTSQHILCAATAASLLQFVSVWWQLKSFVEQLYVRWPCRNWIFAPHRTPWMDILFYFIFFFKTYKCHAKNYSKRNNWELTPLLEFVKLFHQNHWIDEEKLCILECEKKTHKNVSRILIWLSAHFTVYVFL